MNDCKYLADIIELFVVTGIYYVVQTTIVLVFIKRLLPK